MFFFLRNHFVVFLFKTVQPKAQKKKKMSGKKSHKAMSDAEWISRLKKFASTGVWPSNEGNRPAPRQKKWHDIYQKVSVYFCYFCMTETTLVFVDLHN